MVDRRCVGSVQQNFVLLPCLPPALCLGRPAVCTNVAHRAHYSTLYCKRSRYDLRKRTLITIQRQLADAVRGRQADEHECNSSRSRSQNVSIKG